MEIEQLENIREYYHVIKNEVLPDSMLHERVMIVNWLEQQTKMEFKDTSDFYFKMDQFLSQGKPQGLRLKKAREKEGLSLSKCGLILGVSKQFLSEMERSRKPLNQKALRFIEKNEC